VLIENTIHSRARARGVVTRNVTLVLFLDGLRHFSRARDACEG
jgi:hypothetical protein